MEANSRYSGTSNGMVDNTSMAEKERVEKFETNAKEMELETKLTQLKLAVQRSDKILEPGKRQTIRCHLETQQSVNRSSNQFKRLVEEHKIASKMSMVEIASWNDEIESKFEEADLQIARFDDWLAEDDRKTNAVAQEERFKSELKLHEEKLRMQSELANSVKSKPEMKESVIQNAKLPKLVISKFEGSYMDWSRFWGQFTEGIDKSSIAPITKFTYLLELLSPKVKICVESLPFLSEGYNHAKSILQSKYWKESEIVKCYVEEILDLPQITNSNSRRVAEFSEKLTYCVRALETQKTRTGQREHFNDLIQIGRDQE